MTCGTEREKHCSVSDLGRVGAVHDGNQWMVWGTYDSVPDEDLDCLLLFRARSLSPWVTPFRSSSSLYCGKEGERRQYWAVGGNGAVKESRVGVGSSPAPVPVSWEPGSCCSRWCWCRPPRTGSSSPRSCRSPARFAFSPGKRVPPPTGCSASWVQQQNNQLF